MADKKNRVLLVEDMTLEQAAFRQLVKEDNFPFEYRMARSVNEVREILAEEKFDAIITDYQFSDGTAFDIFALSPGIPSIVVTDARDIGVAVKVMKSGADDYLIKDSEQNFLTILPVTVENAIKRKKAEERLRLLESAVVNAKDAIIILEAEPGKMQGRRILYVNDAFTRMTGYTHEEAVKKTLRMLRGPRTSLTALDTIRVALEQCSPVRVELINYRKDGSEFWVECYIAPFADEKGRFSHWVSVQRDITERKKAEGEREKLMNEIEAINSDLTELNSELETIGAERTMSLMALTVADRIRNPAAMIGARCRRILSKEQLSGELRESLQYIMEGSEKLDKIVRDFEALLKNRQSKFKHDDLNAVVEKILSVVEKEAKNKGIEMVVSISKDALRVNMQKDLLRMALFHVMKNSIEATSRGGIIGVETYKESDNVVFSVSDSGYGIPDEDVENIFKPFFSTKERGFGLGLPLVKQIIGEHMGDLIVESRAGTGTTFKLVFPSRWRDERLSEI